MAILRLLDLISSKIRVTQILKNIKLILIRIHSKCLLTQNSVYRHHLFDHRFSLSSQIFNAVCSVSTPILFVFLHHFFRCMICQSDTVHLILDAWVVYFVYAFGYVRICLFVGIRISFLSFLSSAVVCRMYNAGLGYTVYCLKVIFFSFEIISLYC